MSRFARKRRVFFVEEPVFENAQPHLRTSICSESGVRVYTPVLPHGLAQQLITEYQRQFLQSVLAEHAVKQCIAWYYTPMALAFSSALKPLLTVYDCMDELSAFAGAPAAMKKNESTLFDRADLVFTGGASLFESKRKQHGSVHLFPSSVDVAHFSKARSVAQDPDDQAHIAHPRLGYAGVIDERMDLELLRGIAQSRPEWQLVLLGPVVKIDPATLPRAANIHYLGIKQYADLPGYLGGWDIGILPFALNELTRYISPTKTPEYLAAELPVVSTPIRDVAVPYGELGLVHVARDAGEFIRAAETILESPPSVEFHTRVERFLSQSSWDKTWTEMNNLMENKLAPKQLPFDTVKILTPTLDVAIKGTSHV